MPRILMKKRMVKYGIMLAAILTVTLFIFGNSFAGYDMSHDTSNSISEIILPDKYSDSEKVLLIIRKMAHLIEYAALGMAVMHFIKCVEKDYRKKLYALACFYVLFIAVLDEHIQSFSDRTSSTGDILLDFFGALIGFAIVITMHFVYVKLKKRKERRSFVEMVLETEQKEK
jgi:VanZ family protein